LKARKLIGRDIRHYLVKRPHHILTSSLSWNQVQAELKERGTEADEAMLFRGIVTLDGTEYRDKYADSRTHITEHVNEKLV
jgi:hypothetical protein